mgnify:CR=1 FL=1
MPDPVKLRVWFDKALLKLESASITPIRGPRPKDLGSDKVTGKVLIADHI